MRLETSRWLPIAGIVLVAAGSVSVLVYLLRVFPYNGLYGIDSYTYAGQSAALLRELTGQGPKAGALLSANGLSHWPVGYHAHVMLGLVLAGGGVEGGRAITLALAAAVPVLTYVLVLRLAGFLVLPARVAAGVVAAGALLLTATFTRMGTSLMSDVPAMFWALLACVLTIWAWPPSGQRTTVRRPGWWAAGAGAALGMAVLVRYPSALMVVPLLVYLLLRHRSTASGPINAGKVLRLLLVSAAAFALAVLPQLLYLLTHDPGPSTESYFASINLGNMLSRSSSGPDGQEVFPHSMLEFYMLSPLWDSASGFLPGGFLPIALVGLLLLVIRKRWVELAFLITWWLVPALAYATTPYQAHRFALLYIPAIAALVGLGAAAGVEGAALGMRRRSVRRAVGSFGILVPAVLLLLGGGVQGFRSVRSWQATHAAWQAADMALAVQATHLAGNPARAVCFSACAPLDYYVRLPVLDLYNNDEKALAAFIRPGMTVAVVPEKNLATQWAGQPVAQRWAWLQSTYSLVPAGHSGEFSIYRVNRASAHERLTSTTR